MKKTKNTRKSKVVAATKKPVFTVNSTSNSWSWTIYMYWFIILFFIAATFYILGRSHEYLHPAPHNVVVTEEVLKQSEVD